MSTKLTSTHLITWLFMSVVYIGLKWVLQYIEQAMSIDNSRYKYYLHTNNIYHYGNEHDQL